ncbi:MAG: hypothetical protein AAF750_14740 [Planctomycetota bacterium]
MLATAAITTLMQAAPATPPTNAVDHETLLVWAIALMGTAIVMLVIEVFVPSGGILGVLAGIAAIASVVCFFWVNQTAGVIALMLTLLATPFALYFLLKALPYTPIFRLAALDDDGVSKGRAYALENAPQPGQLGSAETNLRPSGSCVIDGRKHDALAVGPWIERGQRVLVIGFSTGQVQVRLATQDDLAPPAQADPPATA